MKQDSSSQQILDFLLQEKVEMQAQMSELRKENKQLRNRLDELLSQLAYLQRKLFGKSSERRCLPDNSPTLFDCLEPQEDLATIQEARDAAQEEIETIIKKKKKRGAPRKDILEGLPVIEKIIEPENLDKTKYKKIGEERTRVLEYQPGRLYVQEIVRPKYALKKAEDDTHLKAILLAELPLLPINKGLAGPSMLAELIQQKYAFHIPFYRQIAQFKQLGIKLSSSTINDWYTASSELLKPLYNKIKETVLQSDYIQVDETVLPVIDKEKKSAVKRYLWAARSPKDNLVFFDYDDGSRSQKTALKILQGFKGYLQSDGYNGYNIFQKNPDIHLCACWAHVRRKYFESLKENEKLAEYAISQIKLLYKIEASLVEKTSLERLQERKRLATPIIDNLEKWMEENYGKVLPRSNMGKAISYNYELLPRLREYLEYDINIDNNWIENAIRPITLGRKNFLFCGNHKSANNTAILFTLINSCKNNDINTRDWLIDVLTRLPQMLQNKEDLTPLFPNKWQTEKSKK